MYFHNVYIKEQLVDNRGPFMYLITYVNIFVVRRPKKNGNSMFRFHCEKKYIDQAEYKKGHIYI